MGGGAVVAGSWGDKSDKVMGVSSRLEGGQWGPPYLRACSQGVPSPWVR